MKHVPKKAIVVMDEAYFEFAQERKDYPNSLKDGGHGNVITLRTFSKAYGLAGLRIGYALGHRDLIAYIAKVKRPFDPGSLAQRGALMALKDQGHLERTISHNKRQYQRTLKFLTEKQFNPIPSATNFITFKTSSQKTCEWMNEELLNRGVIVRPLASNGMPEYIRLSLGTEEEMAHFERAMEEILKKEVS